MTDTIENLRAEIVQLAAKLADAELRRDIAQRQHTTQCAINKTESQRILELTAQLAEAQREAVTLAQYLYNTFYSHEPHYASGKVKWEPCDTPAGVITQIDNMVAGVREQLAEAQRDSARLDWMIEQCAYVVSDPDCCDGYWLRYHRKDGTVWVQATEHETPRAAIDAAKGETS